MRYLTITALLLTASAASASDRTLIQIEPLVPITTGIREARPYRPAATRAWVKPSAGILDSLGEAPANGCEATGGGFRVMSGSERGCVGGP